jgi:glycosyltransferase involved in cell wall biosynthesis
VTSVVLVSPSAKPGGAERALASLARHLPAHGFTPLAILLEHGPLEAWLMDSGCELVVGPAADVDNCAPAVDFVRSHLVQAHAGVVVSNKWKGHIIGGVAAAKAAIPEVWWQHDLWRPNVDPRELSAVPAAAVVCVSDHAARAQKLLTPGMRIVTVHGGVAVEEIAARRGSGTSVREALGWLERPLVGIVGRLERLKGQELFLRAARHVAERRPDARFAIVGGAILGYEGSYPEDLTRLTRELGLGDHVHFAGHQADVYPWLDALDVVVHATPGEPGGVVEAFGLVVVEAMALGKPLVATGLGGPVEIVEDERSGLLVPPGDPRVMAAAILRLLEDPQLAARLGAEAGRRAGKFSEERMAAGFASVLSSVLATAEASAPR